MAYTSGNIFEVFNEGPEKKKPIKKATPVVQVPKAVVKKTPQKKTPDPVFSKKVQDAPQQSPKGAPKKTTNKSEQPQKRTNSGSAQKFGDSNKSHFEKQPASSNWNEQTTWDTEAGVPEAPSVTKPRRQDNTERNDKQKGRRGERLTEEQFGNKRVFERRSGTGRGPTENKKGGFGKNNWGVEGEVVEFTESETVHDAAEAKAEQTADEIQEQPKVEEKKEMSYAEYQDQQAKIKEKLAHIAPPPSRQAGEGVDQSEWHRYTALSRPAAPEDAPQPKKKVEKKDAAAAAPSTEKKKSKTTVKVVPVNEVLPVRPPEDPSRERRRANRGPGGPRNDQQGQGQGQGGQGQGSPRDKDGATRENAPRKHNKKQPQLELSDQNAFPSLKNN